VGAPAYPSANQELSAVAPAAEVAPATPEAAIPAAKTPAATIPAATIPTATPPAPIVTDALPTGEPGAAPEREAPTTQMRPDEATGVVQDEVETPETPQQGAATTSP
jgi:hypothetical protein